MNESRKLVEARRMKIWLSNHEYLGRPSRLQNDLLGRLASHPVTGRCTYLLALVYAFVLLLWADLD